MRKFLSKIKSLVRSYYKRNFSRNQLRFSANKFRYEDIYGEALSVIGGTRFAIDTYGKICHLMGGASCLNNFKCDEEFECGVKIDFHAGENYVVSIPISNGNKKLYGNSISLLHPVGQNIYHFLVEACYDLVKAKLSDIKIDNLLVNADIPKRFLSLIRIIEPSAKIFKVKKNELVYVSSLYAFPIEKSFQVHWGRLSRPKPQYYLDRKIIRALSEILFDAYSRKKFTFSSKKIVFFIRKSKFRNTINEKAIYRGLNNIFICRPEKISFAKLASILNGANFLIAQSSAALANLIFAKGHLKVISWQYLGPEQNENLFRDFVEALGHKFYLLNALPVIDVAIGVNGQNSDITQAPLIFTNFKEIEQILLTQR